MSTVAWLLNLDADHELQKPLGYLPNKKVIALVRQMRERIVALVRPEDVIVGDAALAHDVVGLCWCPTPTALLRLRRAGIAAAPTPPFEVVRRVNHRHFALGLGGGFDGRQWIADEAMLRAALAKAAPSGQWVMKRPHSIAGSGRRVLRDGLLAPHDERWVKATLAAGGLVLEPWVHREGELVVHGYVHRDGKVVLGDVCVQFVDEHGSWLDTVHDVNALSERDVATMTATAGRAASALQEAAYFGPFGVDAFRYRRAGDVVLNACSELNARYTMGWAIGMGRRRPDTEQA